MSNEERVQAAVKAGMAAFYEAIEDSGLEFLFDEPGHIVGPKEELYEREKSRFVEATAAALRYAMWMKQ